MSNAPVAELVDATDLKSVGRKAMPVRFRPGAPFIKDLGGKRSWSLGGHAHFVQTQCSH
jgi:hypothetical protein